MAWGILSLNTLRAFLERQKNLSSVSETTTESDKKVSITQALLTFFLGAILVISGSKLLVNSGIDIAKALQIPSLVIGLTTVAIGTSLPELITAVKKNVADLAIDNIVGANFLNLSFITGASALINPLTMDTFTRTYAFSWLFIMILGMMFIIWKEGKMGKIGKK